MSRPLQGPPDAPQVSLLKIQTMGDIGIARVKRVFVVDSHDIFRAGVTAVLGLQDDVEVVGAGADPADSLEEILELQPDVVLMGIREAEHTQIAALAPLRDTESATRVVVMTRHDHDEALLAAMEIDARAYVTKDVSTEHLLTTISSVVRGKSTVDHTRALSLVRERAVAAERGHPLAGLTRQERNILARLANGLSNKEIAAEMFLVEKTVRNHVTRILSKLGVQRRTQAALIAARQGLLDAEQ